MINFNEVLKILIEGKKVRRKNWNENDFIHIVNDQIVNRKNIPSYLSYISTLTANDWEIYESKPKIFENDTFKIFIENDALIIKNKFCNLNGFCFGINTYNFELLKRAIREAERIRELS